jgi:hypothetical protein
MNIFSNAVTALENTINIPNISVIIIIIIIIILLLMLSVPPTAVNAPLTARCGLPSG